MDINFPKLEEKILKFWQENRIFEKSLQKGKKARNFVFYEGPPTANGRPGIHHVESRVFKDIICRYKTMQGFRVARKAGWDTHGLPVELEVEKTLGLKSKKEIEEYGIGKFNQKCKESVWKYKMEWERLTERIAFWLDLKNPYITYQTSYIETAWWILKKIFQKGLFYQDYKVVPYCPRCGTTLSSHEVAQGYKKVKENAIYVKFPVMGEKNSYFLVWTTTPWTLPANVAIAVNPDIEYVKIKWQEEIYYLAASKSDLFVSKDLANPGAIFATMQGKDLLGREYDPLYSFIKPEKRAHFIVAGDFVSAEDGTGLVHIAPAFGEDDMDVAKKNNLPVILAVDEQGKFKLDVKKWAGMFVKAADPLIIEDLKNRNLLFKEEMYEHDYPFCWRCSSALLYYAKQSWFIAMRQAQKALIINNQKINWVPSHLKEGRFGEWLKDVKDWAISRERYWGTPLPLWQCRNCKNQEFIGSLNDLISQNFSNNNYYFLRHGHSLRQIKKVTSCWPEKNPFPLTEQGRKEVLKSAKELKKEKIDLIFSSDLLRTKETSWIVAKETGAKIVLAKELREYNVGAFNNKDPKLVWDYLKQSENLLSARPERGESLQDVSDRMFQFLKLLNKQYKGKNILLVSHELPLTILSGTLKGNSLQRVLEERQLGKEKGLVTAGWQKISFVDLPFNQDKELDLHRPYIDEVEFYCKKCQGKMKRVPEVLDCWFDSGAMPFAQQHYPFQNKNLIDGKIQFPADYISEAIDQTRGWFYTLLAIATALDFGPPYKNVISLGHVLDEKGEKMSKSKGNVVDPWYILDKYGADASRWYFYTVNQPGDPKLFSEKDVELSLKKFLFTFWNSFVFFDTYRQAVKKTSKTKKVKSSNVLDKWILSKLNGLIRDVSNNLEKYDVVPAARSIENFVVNDFSQWYIRRSRKRFHVQENNDTASKKDFEKAALVLEFCLLQTSKLSAPFIPFLSEEIFQKLGAGKSVHLTDWPVADAKMIDKNLEQEMDKTRELVSLALADRMKAGIKVRQPLKLLKIKVGKMKFDPGLLKLIQEEVNVKEVVLNNEIKTATELDTEITKELKEEGQLREIFRNVQDIRKQAGFSPKDKIILQLFGDDEMNAVFQKNKKMIIREARIQELVLSGKKLKKVGAEKELLIDGRKIYLAIKSVQ